MDKIIEVKNLSREFKIHQRDEGIGAAFKSLFVRKYKTIKAVDSVNFSVEKGDIHALLGPNGSGKSTLIKMFSGILYPSSGELEVMGLQPWESRKQLVKKLGVLFGQKTCLNWDLPAIDTFYLTQVIYRIPTDRFENTMNYLVDLFDVYDIVRKPVRNLSLGERMKCEFITILLHEPELIFLDEPTIGLDIISKMNVRDVVKKLNKDKGTTIILTTHDLADVENLCDKITIINHGGIVYNNYLENLTADFSNKKIIKMLFSEPVHKSRINGFDIHLKNPYVGHLEIENADINLQKDLDKLFTELPIKDIDVNSVDIETVIKSIYEQKNR